METTVSGIGDYRIQSAQEPTRGHLYRMASQLTPRLCVWCVRGRMVRPGVIEVV
jgi:hypothetical protein